MKHGLKFVNFVLLMSVIMSLLPSSFVTAKANEVITIGYSTINSNFIENPDSINSKGYGYDILKKMEEYGDIEFEFVPIDDSIVSAVENKEVDLAGFSLHSKEREARVLFSETPLSKSFSVLVTNDQNALYADPKSMNGKTVATYPDNVAQANFENYCKENGISVNYVYGTNDDYLKMDADYYITYSQHRDVEGMKNVLNLGVHYVYMISHYDNSELMDRLAGIFYNMISTEGNITLELEEKYAANELQLNHRTLTPSEVANLVRRPLEVGYISDYQPISYTNSEGNPDGAMIETMNLLAETYNFEVNYHPYSIKDPPENHENFYILVSLYGDREHSSAHYDVTDSYYEIPMFAQVPLDLHRISSDFNEMMQTPKTIGSLKYISVDINSTLPEAEIVYYDLWSDVLDDFEAGKIDAVVSTENATTYAEQYLDEMDRTTVHTDFTIPMRFFISKEISEIYTPIFNVMLDNFSESEYRGILSRHESQFYPESSFAEFVSQYWYYFAIGVITFVAILVGIGYRNQKEKQRALKKAYNTDALTGLMAIHKFRETVDDVLQDAKPSEYEIISLDVDMFKTINTHYSNERGTNVIIAIGDALKVIFKDTPAYLSRRTADQFLILRPAGIGGSMREMYNYEILPKVRDALGDKYNFSMSFGNVIIENTKEKGVSAIGQADNARIIGKKKHETTFTTFDNNMKKMYDNRINLTFRMEQALKDREFRVVYQPKVDFKTLRIGGAEALVRWKPKLGDTIYPDEFIPVFEENGFITELDMYVLEDVCKFVRQNSKKMEIPRISVNLSAFTIFGDEIISKITNIISTYEIKPEEIELEITESAIVGDEDTFLLKVEQLRKIGFPISIDDFGAGVSSLNRLSSVDADVLKLDKEFFKLKNQSGKSSKIVADVIKMAKNLNMMVVAEGVETFAQAVWLKGIDCDYAQGFFFERPLEQEAFEEILLNKKAYEIKVR